MFTVMNGGYLIFLVRAVCNGTSSGPVVINATYPDLLRDFRCSVRSSKLTHCSWHPSNLVPDLRFFYRLVDQTNGAKLLPLQECSQYDTGGVQRGCSVQDANYMQNIDVLFNGTLNNSLIRNTYRIMLRNNVRPDALNWTVTQVGGDFHIRWSPPDIKVKFWKYNISYTECNENKSLPVGEKTSTKLNRVSHCQYRMTIKAIYKGKEVTPSSEEKYFGAETDPNALVYAAVIIPLVFIVLVALACVCFRKHKESIFPKVPEPRDLLADNNNKIPVGHLYTPAKEDNCEISVMS
ncbi:uncharacterized protein LOC142993120 isoform X2 [Genypterus blacodes]